MFELVQFLTFLSNSVWLFLVPEKVFMMMSGGVDSSVAAALLVEQGYEVIGVFMRCWSLNMLRSMNLSDDLYGCFWEDDQQDATLVAKKLNIPFETWDFEQEYKKRIIDYMINGYKQGITPNPDVMCNGLIKFGIFYERAMAMGADFVATGHYARVTTQKHLPINQDTSFQFGYEGQGGNNYVVKYQNTLLSSEDLGQGGTCQAETPQETSDSTGQHVILRGLDPNKDQSYFLWQIKKEQLPHILFPIGEFASKAEVRATAERFGLNTSSKPDSQGLCFIGDTPLREMLVQTLGQKEGEIVDISTNKVLGHHPGAFLYTIGQREKLGLSGGPWFVSSIDVKANIVYVTHGNKPDLLYKTKVICQEINWIWEPIKEIFECEAQIRYRQGAHKCTVKILPDKSGEIIFHQAVRAVAPGQSIVFYTDDILIGGGVIIN